MWALCREEQIFYCVSFKAPRMDKCVSYYPSVKESGGVRGVCMKCISGREGYNPPDRRT